MLELLAALAIVVVTHEAGHALAALVCRHRIFEVQVGAGPTVRFRVGSVRVAVAPVPVGGHIRTATRDLHHFRRRAIVVASGGVIANVVVGVVAAIAGWPALFLLSFALGAINLWPVSRREFGGTASDGRVIWDLVRNRPGVVDEDRSGWWAAAALAARDDDDLDRAAAVIQEGRATVGSTASIESVAGLIAYEQRRYRDAVAAYARLLDHPRLSHRARSGLSADAAWSAYLSGDEDLAAFVQPWARFAGHGRNVAARRRLIAALAAIDTGEIDAALASIADLDNPTAALVRGVAALASGDVGAARDVAADAPSDHPLTAVLRQRLSTCADGGGMADPAAGDN